MARILIVGGTGLISTSITRQLVERGDRLIGAWERMTGDLAASVGEA